jgi:tetratricopeptide (TPR) repeat protein
MRHLVTALGVSGRTAELHALAGGTDVGATPERLLTACSARLWTAPVDALEACDRARVAGAGDTAEMLAAISLLTRGDRAALRAHLARMESAGTPSFAWYMSVWLDAQEGRWDDVRSALDAAGDPDQSWFHSQAVEIVAGSGRTEDTARAALRVLELDRALATNVAVHLAYLGDLRRAAEFAPYLPAASPRAAVYEAVVRWRSGDLPSAIDRLREVAAVAPIAADPAIPPPAYLLGEALGEAGRDGEAIDALRHFLALPLTYPSWFQPRARYHLARCLERAGDRAAASAEIEQLLRLWARASPDQPLLAEARALGARLGVR